MQTITSALIAKWPNGLPIIDSPIELDNGSSINLPNNETLDLRGMLVTVILRDANVIETTYYFGYDYETGGWYCLDQTSTANQLDAIFEDLYGQTDAGGNVYYSQTPSIEGMTFNIENGTIPAPSNYNWKAPWLTSGTYTITR